MSGSLRWLAVLGMLGLAVVIAPVYGQRAGRGGISSRQPAIVTNPNPMIAPGLNLSQYAYNYGVYSGTYGKTSPFLLGYNPFIAGAKTIVNPNGYPGYGGGGYNYPYLSTGSGLSFPTGGGGGFGGGSPYVGGSTLSTSPYGGGYSLSTSPDGSGYGGGYPGYGGGYPGYGDIPPSAANLAAMGSLARATAAYWTGIGQAQLLREQARQARFDTMRKQIEFERWYESMKDNAVKMRDRELATDLERYRRNPPAVDIWSGAALNGLLRSVQNAGKGALKRGPNIPLDEDILRQINLTADRGATGSIAMLKTDGNLTWPEPLTEKQFDDARKKLDRNLRVAVATLKGKDPIAAPVLKDINADFKALNALVNESANDLSPGQYIEAKRYLNQLAAAIKALSNPKVINYFNNMWVAKGKNVAELMEYMTREGLTFAPSAPGEEAAYTSLYQSLRDFEAGVVGEKEATTEPGERPARPAERPERPERPEKPGVK
jgi:hypothetical protein